MFVTQDDSYLDFYYHRAQVESDSSDVEGEESQGQTQINLGWVEDLLAWTFLIYWFFIPFSSLNLDIRLTVNIFYS